MSAPSLRSTALLTELLGFPPISLVDDIINNVNEIMYKCTAAMEKYLLRKSIVDDFDYSDEIKVGVAKLETLLEHTVDKNFDKLELYVLRNVLRIPDELIDENVFLLPHQVGLDTSCLSNIEREKLKFEMKVMELEQKLARHEQLRREIERVSKLKSEFVKFKKLVVKSIEKALEDEQVNGKDSSNQTMKDVLRSLKPIDDTLRYLVSQLKEIYTENEQHGSIAEIKERIRARREKRLAADELSRSRYLERATQVTLDQLKLNDSQLNTKGQQINESGIRQLEIQDPDLSIFFSNSEVKSASQWRGGEGEAGGKKDGKSVTQVT